MAVSKETKDAAFELYKMLRTKYALSDRAIAIGLLQLHLELERTKKIAARKDFEKHFAKYRTIENKLKDAESRLHKVELMRDELVKKLDSSIPVDALEKHAIKLLNDKPELLLKLKRAAILRIYRLALEKGIVKTVEREKVVVKTPSASEIIDLLRKDPSVLENAYRNGRLKMPHNIGMTAKVRAELRRLREEFKEYKASVKTVDFYRTNREALVAAAEAVCEDPEISKNLYKDWVPKIELESMKAEMNARIEALQAGIKRLQNELQSKKSDEKNG
jgi:uncharacterized small protein (DUF1192 family)